MSFLPSPATIPELLFWQAQARPNAPLLFERRRDGRWQVVAAQGTRIAP